MVENEAIIDLRYPQFRSQVRAFVGSGILEEAQAYGVVRILRDAGRRLGYTIEVGWLRMQADEDHVRCVVTPDGRPGVRITYRGFSHEIGAVAGDQLSDHLRRVLRPRTGSAQSVRQRKDGEHASRRLRRRGHRPPFVSDAGVVQSSCPEESTGSLS